MVERSEVVVVGYGTQKKANLTGAVSTVDLSKTMAGRPQQDVAKGPARCCAGPVGYQ